MADGTTIMMIGPDGVGKTTLLATMYHELAHINDNSGFTLMAAADTEKDLQEAYEKLSTIVTQPTFTPTGSLLQGTAGIVERHFHILFNGNREVDFTFCDIAGGIIRASEEHQDVIEFKAKLQQAIVIINVIDGSALVESDEELARNKNEPQHIYELLQPVLQQDQQAYLILFVITKCEAWLKNEAHQEQLEQAFTTQYQMIIDLVETQTNSVAVLIPVKTMGCVEFTHVDYRNQTNDMIFVRKPNLPFQPQHTDQPLRYALAFALLQHNRNRSKWRKFMRWLWNEEVAFQNALIQFAEARHRHFKIYGNASLIEVIKT